MSDMGSHSKVVSSKSPDNRVASDPLSGKRERP
jgi:hypothetical protein